MTETRSQVYTAFLITSIAIILHKNFGTKSKHAIPRKDKTHPQPTPTPTPTILERQEKSTKSRALYKGEKKKGRNGQVK